MIPHAVAQRCALTAPPGGVYCIAYHHDADADEQTYFVTLRLRRRSIFPSVWDWAAYAA
jgi:hypothetical protein